MKKKTCYWSISTCSVRRRYAASGPSCATSASMPTETSYGVSSTKKVSMDIRLLVTDMDGTLLNDRKEIDPSFWPMHQCLKERETLLAVASGRQVFSLEKSFADIR